MVCISVYDSYIEHFQSLVKKDREVLVCIVLQIVTQITKYNLIMLSETNLIETILK
jgi:hypothetical protein